MGDAAMSRNNRREKRFTRWWYVVGQRENSRWTPLYNARSEELATEIVSRIFKYEELPAELEGFVDFKVLSPKQRAAQVEQVLAEPPQSICGAKNSRGELCVLEKGHKKQGIQHRPSENTFRRPTKDSKARRRRNSSRAA